MSVDDYGAKASASGHDVETAADFMQTFSSAWPLLKIEHSDTVSITLNGTPQTIYTHNLGYPPMYLIASGGMFDTTAGARGIGVDSSVLAYDAENPTGATYTFRYYICRLPLTQNFTAPIIETSQTRTTTDPDYGIKVAKPGKDTSSADLRDFALYSSSRSLMVHKVDYGQIPPFAGEFLREVPHGLGYAPTAFCYIKFGPHLAGYNDNYHYIQTGPQGIQDAYYFVDETNMYIFESGAIATQGGDATAIFLKDPFAKDTVSINFP